MPDTITKVLFRRGTDVIRRTGGGSGVKFNLGEPAFVVDTGRFYIGDGEEGTLGGLPIGIKNHGIFTPLFDILGPNGYDTTTYSVLTSNGIDVGDILFDNISTVMYYVSSKNPYNPVPDISELVRFNLLSRTNSTNGAVASKNLEVITVGLDPNYFDVTSSIDMLSAVNIRNNSLLVEQNAVVDNNLTIGGASTFGGSMVVGTGISNKNITTYGILYTQSPSHALNSLGGDSEAWYNAYTTLNSSSATWNSANATLQAQVPFGWQWNTTNNTISTYSTNQFKVGINSAPNFVGLTIKGTDTLSTALSVYGSIVATGDLTVFTTSDANYKKNILPIENALEKITKINGVSFDWDCNFKDGHELGVIAQDVIKVLPEIVTKRYDNSLAVNYQNLIPVLIEAIKELNFKLENYARR